MVVDGDPLADISVLRDPARIALVIKDGKIAADRMPDGITLTKAGSAPTRLPGLLQHEIAQLLGGLTRGLAGRVAHDEGVRLAVEFVQVEPAAARPVGGRETVGHVRGDVVVAGALHDDRRRQRHRRLAAFEDQLRVALCHLGFGGPPGIVRLDQPLLPFSLDHAVARQRVRDRPAQHDIRQARILAGASASGTDA